MEINPDVLGIRRSSAMYNLRLIFLKWHTNHMQTNENPIWKCTYCFNRSCLFFFRGCFFFCFPFSVIFFETISWKSCSKQVWKKPILFFFVSLFLFFSLCTFTKIWFVFETSLVAYDDLGTSNFFHDFSWVQFCFLAF